MTTAPTLVLDLDGTLVDTAPDLLATLNAILAEENHAPLTLDQIYSMTGAGARALLTRGLDAAGVTATPAQMDDLFARFIAYYGAHIADHSQPFPGVEATLERFAQAGWRLAVCTNKPVALAQLLLEELGMASRFAAICGGDSFPVRKPDPAHIIETVAAAGGDLDRAIMVGDSAADIDAAKAAGVPCIGLTFGYTDIPVAELGPDATLDHFSEVFATANRLLGIHCEP